MSIVFKNSRILNCYFRVHSVMVCTIAVLLLFVIAQGTASAAFISYTDRTAFENAALAATLTLTTEDFTNDPDASFTISDGTNGVTFETSIGGWKPAGYLGGKLEVGLYSTNVTGAVVGVGFDIGTNNSDATIALNDRARTAWAGSTPYSFIGLLSTDGTLISIIDEIGNYSNSRTGISPWIDNLVVVTDESHQVPEPSLGLLLGMSLIGLVGVGTVRKIKQKKIANT